MIFASNTIHTGAHMRNFGSKLFATLTASSTLLLSSACLADAAAGKALYDARCVTCHGPIGAGDGPISAGLPPEMKPRNLQEGKYKFAVDEAKFSEMLKKGGSGVGLNPLMPPQPDLKDAEIKDLYSYVKSLKK